MEISTRRRLACAAIALVLSGLLFRCQLAAAIVTVGDDALHRGDVARALRTYARARFVDPGSEVAADRLAFFLTLRHRAQDAEQARMIASSALRYDPASTALLADRALAEMQLTRWHEAERDFAAAGTLAGDPRYDHFAARMALRAGRRPEARIFTLRALAIDPKFAPAAAMLRAIQ